MKQSNENYTLVCCKDTLLELRVIINDNKSLIHDLWV